MEGDQAVNTATGRDASSSSARSSYDRADSTWETDPEDASSGEDEDNVANMVGPYPDKTHVLGAPRCSWGKRRYRIGRKTLRARCSVTVKHDEDQGGDIGMDTIIILIDADLRSKVTRRIHKVACKYRYFE
ncbi:unnamed protein product [Phytophthora fragariaefolia]|uniref:Unnamed protein product n=1 Tax=Phytophthora fragariaefolia TaxID=1490495 RepID=A0A9W7CYY3_9STRA|nr:unnamed protein product [Phytophthora fragariaefolia]